MLQSDEKLGVFVLNSSSNLPFLVATGMWGGQQAYMHMFLTSIPQTNSRFHVACLLSLRHICACLEACIHVKTWIQEIRDKSLPLAWDDWTKSLCGLQPSRGSPNTHPGRNKYINWCRRGAWRDANLHPSRGRFVKEWSRCNDEALRWH